MLKAGRIPMNEQEKKAVDKLLKEKTFRVAWVTRTQPGNTGPLALTLDDDVFVISDDGVVEEVAA